jgi:cytochrome c2
MASAQGNAAAGKTLSTKCTVCHSLAAGENRIGPSLAGVVGRKAGSLPGFNYSPAMKSVGLTWTAETLDKYLTNPRALVPGTKMIFPGLPTPADRANLIAFLSQNGAAASGK